MDSTFGGTSPETGGAVKADLLLLDNDARIVELVSWFLTERGYSVRTAESFSSAREQIALRRPDLLISDVDLGTESAVTELPRLHEEGLLPPTLVVSGYLDAEIKLALLDVPEVLGTLAKPFEFSDLETKIESCALGGGGLQPHAAGKEIPRPAGPDASAAELPASAPAPAPAESSPVPAASSDEAVEDEDGWIEITPRS